MSSITALMPLKIKSGAQFKLFKTSFSSYWPILEKHHVSLKIADESEKEYSHQIKDFLRTYDVEKIYLEGRGFVHSIQKLIQSVKEDYFFFILDDVELLKEKDFIGPSLAAFKENSSLIQIKYGAGLAARKSKEENLRRYRDVYRPLQYNSDIIWINKIGVDQENYIFSHYNCVLKTKIFQQVDSRITSKLPHFDAYVVFLKKIFLRELNHYETGWLNFEDYLYTHGRPQPTRHNQFKGNIDKKKAISLLEDKSIKRRVK